MALTDSRIRTAKKAEAAYKLTDAGGLYIEIRPSGSKFWRYRYRIGGKENLFALGEYAHVPNGESETETHARVSGGRLSLAEARTERDKARSLVKQGIHPSHNRQALKVAKIVEGGNTFEALAREWIAKRKARWTPYYLKQVENFLKADVFPYIGSLPVRSITSAHMLEILRRVEKRAPTVALLIRQWCSAVFRYGVSTLRADADPTFALQGAVHRQKVQHRKPLTRGEIPRFLKKIYENGGNRQTLIALELLLLFFVRPIELRAAEWPEFDFEAKQWRIPAERMKMRESHIVPLTKQALALLRELKTLTGEAKYLFPNLRRPKTFMSGTTLNRVLERMGYAGQFSSHGCRATASTILNEMGYSGDWIERQLAHKERNAIRASYNQAQYLAERTVMMQDWANLLDSLVAGAAVTPIRRKK